MSAIFLKQPNGKYCRYSSIVDFVTDYNMTIENVKDYLLMQAKAEIEERLKTISEDKEKRGWFSSFEQMTKAMELGVENGNATKAEYEHIIESMRNRK